MRKDDFQSFLFCDLEEISFWSPLGGAGELVLRALSGVCDKGEKAMDFISMVNQCAFLFPKVSKSRVFTILTAAVPTIIPLCLLETQRKDVIRIMTPKPKRKDSFQFHLPLSMAGPEWHFYAPNHHCPER